MLPYLKRHFSLINIRNRFKPPFKVGLTAQLTIIVCSLLLISLITITVTTGLYFTKNFKSVRAERLEVAAQLKSSQIDQNLNYLYYQIYWLSTRDTIQDALVNFRAGNSSQDNWASAEDSLEKFLGSSDLFSVARVYDTSFNNVLNTTNNGSGENIPESVLTQLFPLSGNAPLSSSLLTTGIVTDPVLNSTTYLLSMSLPISTNPSIILNSNEVAGYITVVASADSLKAVVNDTVALDKSYVLILSAVFDNSSSLVGYHYVFPPLSESDNSVDVVYPIKNDTFISSAFNEGKSGSVMATNMVQQSHIAVGYSPTSFKLVSWVAVITQPENIFLAPVIQFIKIFASCICGIAVFMWLLTYFIARWAVQPIIRLQKATEVITAGRGLKHYSNSGNSESNTIMSHSRTRSSSNQLHAMKLFNKSVSKDVSGADINPKYHMYNQNAGGSTGSFSARNSQSINRSDVDLNTSTTNGSVRMSNDSSSYISDRCMKSTNLEGAYVPVYRRFFQDELSELTDTFNTMTDELDRHYALLEERVRARTKQLEAAKIQAEFANEAKTVFIANISHELRTPLNGILGMTAIAMAETDMQKVQNSLKLIFRSGELLLHILTELLTFSKNVLKRTKLEERDFSVMDIALQVKSIFGKLAKDQHVRLSISLTPNFIRSLVLWGDSNRIIQIVMNLVSNALKFTPVDGKVDVRIKLLGEYDKEKSESVDFKEVFILPGTEVNDDLEQKYTHVNTADSPSPESSSTSNSSSTDEKCCPDVSTSASDLTESSQDDSNDFDEEEEGDGNEEKDEGTEDEDIEDESKDDQDDRYVESTEEEQKSYSESSQEIEEDEESKNDKSERLSLITTNSSSSYDDAIFHSQFKKVLSSAVSDEEDRPFKEITNPKTWVISIEVEDSGSGIDPSLHESVFEPFVQGDQTLSRQYGGTGLGLSICRQLARMMKGTMKLDSTVGVGSKFTFTVPLLQTKELVLDDNEFHFEDEFNPTSKKNRKVRFKTNSSKRSVQTSKSKSSFDAFNSNIPSENKSGNSAENSVGSVRVDRPFLQSTGTATSTRSIPSISSNVAQPRVLVAEDNNVNQEVIKRMLELEGILDIDMACDGQEAYDKVKEMKENGESYTIIFMDVQMPKVDGLLATKMIRNDLLYQGSIVALTAYADDSNIKVCLESGMNGFLPKPIKRSLLREIIEKYCPKTDKHELNR
ncbi:osmosensing histidine protein kinase SLN1 [Kluyveromyces marxianus]|nr:osmosensing histidine protein kinase SLN1 [Kluyveromyces marxianus]